MKNIGLALVLFAALYAAYRVVGVPEQPTTMEAIEAPTCDTLLPAPTHHYGDRVEVAEGFYKGLEGVVTAYSERSGCYTVETPWINGAESKELELKAWQIKPVEPVRLQWGGLCCGPSMPSADGKKEADALQRRAAENAAGGAVKSIEAAGYTLDDLPEHPAAPWPPKPEVESIDPSPQPEE